MELLTTDQSSRAMNLIPSFKFSVPGIFVTSKERGHKIQTHTDSVEIMFESRVELINTLNTYSKGMGYDETSAWLCI